MARKLFLIGIFILSYLLTGCGVRPQVDFYVNPVAVGEEQQVNAGTGMATMEEAGVTVTVSAVDTVDLLNVTSDEIINPYIYVSDWGTARPRYTVFDVTIKNNRESEVQINPSKAVLMDETGKQYDAIPYETFKERYSSSSRSGREVIYYDPPPVYYRSTYRGRRWRRRPWYYHYDRYRDRGPYYTRQVYGTYYFKRAVVSGTMLKAVKLYPGGKRQGFLVFPVMASDVGGLKLIIPGITIRSGEKGKGKKAQVKFQFHFERVPAAKGKNDDKEDAGAG